MSGSEPTRALDQPVSEVPSATREVGKGLRWVERVLLALAALFWGLHFVHLRADFPNNFFWRDWAKYTDEGWYGSAAIRLYQLGHWNLPGDFNPAAALPVWPAIEAVVFRFTGVSLVAARALTVVVFGLILVASYLLMRREGGEPESLAPAGTVLLLAVSPLFFVFSRLAILEPMLILLTLLALLAASAAWRAEGNKRVCWTVALGLLLPAMVLTKTTAVFLFPAVFWMLLAGTGYRLGAFLRLAACAGVIAAAAWGAYYGLLVRPRYLEDYKYLFSANQYTGITKANYKDIVGDVLTDGIWIGKVLYALGVLAVIGAAVRLVGKGWRSSGLLIALLLWVFGYVAFITYHANPQPRYYLVIALTMTMLVVLIFEPLLAAAVRSWSSVEVGGVAATAATDRWLLRVCAAMAAAALGFVAVHGAMQTVGFVLHPEYTWVDAAEKVKAAVDAESARDPGHSRVVLSISGADLSLMTGLPTICDDFGSMTLQKRIATYKPGWFATWNEIEDDKMEALSPMYRLVRVMAVPAFDDTDRNLLILYRLDPIAQAAR